MSPISSARFQAALADRYAFDRVLGWGGMGTVFLARDVKHGRQVAIKAVFPELVSNVASSKFLREIRLTARLQHPHVLPLLDSGDVAGCAYYVMPYVKGGSLRDLLERKGRLSVSETRRFVRGLVGALEHAHENRIVHCDIKPENILISGGHAILTDFGISRAANTDNHPWRASLNSPAGTAAYVSPEQASGDSVVDVRSDVYGLACVVFEMLSGRAPFEGKTDLAIVSKRFTQLPPSLSRVAAHVPSGASSAVRRAMSVDPSRRYQDVGKFLRAFERGLTLGARPVAGMFTLGAARLRAIVSHFRKSSIKQSQSTAQDIIDRSKHSLETAKLAAKTSTGANWEPGH